MLDGLLVFTSPRRLLKRMEGRARLAESLHFENERIVLGGIMRAPLSIIHKTRCLSLHFFRVSW